MASNTSAADQNIERIAKAFCEASGLYKWEDTKGALREWYLGGARAIEIGIAQLRMENFGLKQALEMAGVAIETYGKWRVIKDDNIG